MPIYTVRKIVSAKARLWFILNQNLARSAYRLVSVQAASCFKQTTDMPVRSRFYGRTRKFLLEAFYTQSLSAQTKF